MLKCYFRRQKHKACPKITEKASGKMDYSMCTCMLVLCVCLCGISLHWGQGHPKLLHQYVHRHSCVWSLLDNTFSHWTSCLFWCILSLSASFVFCFFLYNFIWCTTNSSVPTYKASFLDIRSTVLTINIDDFLNVCAWKKYFFLLLMFCTYERHIDRQKGRQDTK